MAAVGGRFVLADDICGKTAVFDIADNEFIFGGCDAYRIRASHAVRWVGLRRRRDLVLDRSGFDASAGFCVWKMIVGI